ncbi:MAG: MBL fold metallo-hydrolase [Solirubrobacterales bacterium]|nr:MBL fold metallo-hydrolase [Solirubrobacterales bacterium]MBV9915996.1 MBL fold metallo-hydrolase [Solirubrobacterales bacterium]
MPDVQLRFLGCGDAFASGGRFQTAFLLEGGEEPLLIDCGASTLIALKRTDIASKSLGYIAISHLHGDHFGGLPWLVLDGQFSDRTRPLTIAGPPGLEARFRETFQALYPGSIDSERPFEINLLELPEREPRTVGPATLTPLEVTHSSGAPSYALRVQYGGKLIAYSGDTGWTDVLFEVADGADVFICECNFFDREASGHMNYRTLSEKTFNCGRLLLTHLSDEMLAHADLVELEMARDGETIAV